MKTNIDWSELGKGFAMRDGREASEYKKIVEDYLATGNIVDAKYPDASFNNVVLTFLFGLEKLSFDCPKCKGKLYVEFDNGDCDLCHEGDQSDVCNLDDDSIWLELDRHDNLMFCYSLENDGWYATKRIEATEQFRNAFKHYTAI